MRLDSDPKVIRDLERLRSLDLQAKVYEGVDELTADVLARWLAERHAFALALAKRA